MFLECIPSVSWWVELLNSDELSINQNHSMQKQTALSQYKILTANGVLQLSVPTKKETRRGAFDKVEISYAESWQIEHWRAIQSAYLRSPFFIYYDYKIEPVFKREFKYLFEFNNALLDVLVDCLKLGIELQYDTMEAKNYSSTDSLQLKEYPQVFDQKFNFVNDLSVLDLLFNLGPEAESYLRDQASMC